MAQTCDVCGKKLEGVFASAYRCRICRRMRCNRITGNLGMNNT